MTVPKSISPENEEMLFVGSSLHWITRVNSLGGRRRGRGAVRRPDRET
jgi:hypothetical protein